MRLVLALVAGVALEPMPVVSKLLRSTSFGSGHVRPKFLWSVALAAGERLGTASGARCHGALALGFGERVVAGDTLSFGAAGALVVVEVAKGAGAFWPDLAAEGKQSGGH